MFHVEHCWKVGAAMLRIVRSTRAWLWILAVQTNQGDHGENYRAEEDLSNVIVEDLLVRARGIDGLGFLLVRFDVEEGIDWVGYVLFGVHVVAPLLRHRTFPVFSVFMGEFPHF
jgi:hypothetical protein